MSLLSRFANAFRGNRLNREINEEFEAHIADAVEQGQDAAEARRAFGSLLRQREASRDVRLIVWLDSLRADVVFGWRQLVKHKITSAAAVLSLALAIGSCTAAFRLIDALLLRPLPVVNPEELYALNREGIGFNGKQQTFDGWAHPAFRLMRAAVKDRAELVAISYAERTDITFRSDAEMEKACVQYVSGWMFRTFGVGPAAGRVLSEEDDLQPGAHPVAVISEDYWRRRFGRDRGVVGRTFRLGDTLYQIVGVSAGPFTGTETGTVSDLFLPTMMHLSALRDDATWHRTIARLRPGVAVEPVRAQLNAVSRAFEERRAMGFTGMTKASRDRFVNQTVRLEPAQAGFSGLQQEYRRALTACGVLVLLVLLIACANVANLMTAQAAARAREMALRVSIGAGRWRLIQLVLVESAWVAGLASGLGAAFAWWAAPFVVSRINPPDNPARLALPADGRVLLFAFGLTVAVTVLFGLAPALRASSVRPAAALKDGSDGHSKRRLMHLLIAFQVAVCFVVLFVAGLFTGTFQRLSNRPFGFSTERIVTIETTSRHAQPAVYFDQVASHLRSLPGVEAVAIADWPLPVLSSWNSFISVNEEPPGPVPAYFLGVSPGWQGVMKVRLIEGADLLQTDTTPGAALINETFARQFFGTASPVGKIFGRGTGRYRVAGVVADAPYRDLREPILPVAYVPFHRLAADGGLAKLRGETFVVRTAAVKPQSLVKMLRREVGVARPEIHVENVRTEEEVVQALTIRERLLAMLALFFAMVSLALAGVGLYGVLDYSVLQRRREIGIRLAIGAHPAGIARLVTGPVLGMVLIGTASGLGIGLSSAPYLEALLYGVKATDAGILTFPALTILGTAVVTAIPAVLRAVRIDPARMLRAD